MKNFDLANAGGLRNPLRLFSLILQSGARIFCLLCLFTFSLFTTKGVCQTDVDYGDLVDTNNGTGTGNYETLAANGGPSHIITSDLQLGRRIDADTNGQPSILSNGDDDDGNDDEDGIAIFPAFILGEVATFTVDLTNTTGEGANLYGFIDWNNDGSFDDIDEAADVVIVNDQATTADIVFNVPAGAVTGANLGARFRLTTDDLSALPQASEGAASDGEVEDYLVQVLNPTLCIPGSRLVIDDFNASPGFELETDMVGSPEFLEQATTNSLGGSVGLYTILQSNGGSMFSFSKFFVDDGTLSVNEGTNGDTDSYITWDGPAANPTPNTVDATTGLGGIDFSGSTFQIDYIESDEIDVSSTRTVTLNLTLWSSPTAISQTTLVIDSSLTFLQTLTFPNPIAIAGGGADLSAVTAIQLHIDTEGTAIDLVLDNLQAVCQTRADFGDLPDASSTVGDGTASGNYQTLAIDNGPSHIIDPMRELFIGTGVDADSDGQQSSLANGDDDDGNDDEEFILPQFDLSVPNPTLTIPVTNNTGVDAKFYAFFDWNVDGQFSGIDEVIAPQTVGQGSSNVVLNLNVPASSVGNMIGVRFRLTTDMDLMNSTDDRSVGPAIDGEVEDYMSVGGVLPVELVSFKGSIKDCQVILNWATASEENFSHFEVQRSINGKVFEHLDKIAGAGNSTGYNEYQLIDDTHAQTQYYRLKMIDEDGTYEYSDVIAVSSDCDTKSVDLSVYPSPIDKHEFLTVEFSASSHTTKLIITDLMGQQLIQLDVYTIDEGRIKFQVDVSSLAAGVYFITNELGQVQQFVVTE
ncbi:MAG: GEVED domain-containing protein [Bacteroidota bacterium]